MDRLVLDVDQVDIDEHHRDGCSHAVALGAAPASASGPNQLDIVRGMGRNPVNPPQVTSAMGRGSNLPTIGESPHRLEHI